MTELRPAIPEKEDNLQYDLRNLAASDITPVTKETLVDMTRDNVQLLVNKLFVLPTDTTEDGILAQLPELDQWVLPREKLAPKEKHKTRWEKFAEKKGIEKRKRGRMVWNEQVKDWVPRWGFNSTKHIEDKHNWVIETKPGQDPNECPFQKRELDKKLQKAKQKLQEVRNIADSLGERLPAGAIGTPGRLEKRGKANLDEALRRAQVSSASKGRFDEKAKGEKDCHTKGEKKKFVVGNERDSSIKLMDRVLKGEHNRIDKGKAANWAIATSEKQRAEEKAGEPEKKRRKRK